MYEIYIDNIALPVAPESIETKVKSNNETLTLINQGEVNIPKPPALSGLSFTARLPRQEYPWAFFPLGFVPPEEFLLLFEKLKNECRACEILIQRKNDRGDLLGKSESTKWVLEDYTIKENAEDGLDISVDLEFKKYRDYGTYIVKSVSENGSATVKQSRDSSGIKIPATYKIQSGDSLFAIAKKLLGDEGRRYELYYLNQDVIENTAKSNGLKSSGQGNRLFPGTVLKLPGGAG